MVIDGYTQPGASANTQAMGNDAVLQVVLNGDQFFDSLVAVGLRLTGGDSTVRGLVINGWNGLTNLEAGIEVNLLTQQTI